MVIIIIVIIIWLELGLGYKSEKNIANYKKESSASGSRNNMLMYQDFLRVLPQSFMVPFTFWTFSIL